jgi:hypothetical protein
VVLTADVRYVGVLSSIQVMAIRVAPTGKPPLNLLVISREVRSTLQQKLQ